MALCLCLVYSVYLDVCTSLTVEYSTHSYYLHQLLGLWVVHAYIFLLFSYFHDFDLQVQVFAAAGALYSLNAHCNTMFIPFGQKGCHLMGQCCPVCPLKVNEGLCNCLLSYKQLCVIYSFTAVSNKIKTSVCNVFYFIDKYQYLGRICCPYLQGRRVEVKVSGTAKILVSICWNDINRC